MENIFGIIGSLVYIFFIIGIATLVAKFSKGSTETSRKVVHVLVGNWVFISLIFTNIWALLLVPFTFIIINSLSLKYTLISAMERKDDSLGTVYYAISMFVLSGAGFIFGWKMLPFIGLLTMAYGDGLAAVIGKRWGKTKPFSFAPEKTLVGSMTVLFISFVVTIGAILLLGDVVRLERVGILMVFIIGILTAIFSVFAELIGKKGCDNITLPIGAGLFATLSFYYGNLGFYLYLLISVIILIIAYKRNSITADGMVAAILTAVTLYAFGGLWIGISLLTLFVFGSVISWLKNEVKSKAKLVQESSGARNWKQVLCNSLPASILLWLSILFPNQDFLLLLAFGVFAAAAADTFSSEIGMLSKGRVFNILSGKVMKSGLSGGVTWLGLFAGLVGSLLLSLFALPQFGLFGMFFITILGFLGTIVDSILGVIFQRKYVGIKGELQENPTFDHERPVSGMRVISNNVVNLISLSLIAFGGYIFCLIVSL